MVKTVIAVSVVGKQGLGNSVFIVYKPTYCAGVPWQTIAQDNGLFCPIDCSVYRKSKVCNCLYLTF